MECARTKSEKLTGGRAAEGARDVGHVGDDGLDAVPFAFNLRLEGRHPGE
jgi:hypothetical protein